MTRRRSTANIQTPMSLATITMIKGRPSSLIILLPPITLTCTRGSLTHSGTPVFGSLDSSFSTISTDPLTDTVGPISFPIIIATTRATGYIALILRRGTMEETSEEKEICPMGEGFILQKLEGERHQSSNAADPVMLRTG